MADKPIIFSAPMVRALLDGTKTQTRRVLTLRNGFIRDRSDAADCVRILPGYRLWVREAFVTGHEIDDEFGRPVGDRKVWYRATDSGLTWYDPDSESTIDNPPWKPSIHMPRWASRLTLTVTDVTVQPLLEISRGDAMAEGCPFPNMADGPDPRAWFRDLWNSLHGPEAWAANPWVAAYTFTVERGNIDQMPGWQMGDLFDLPPAAPKTTRTIRAAAAYIRERINRQADARDTIKGLVRHHGAKLTHPGWATALRCGGIYCEAITHSELPTAKNLLSAFMEKADRYLLEARGPDLFANMEPTHA